MQVGSNINDRAQNTKYFAEKAFRGSSAEQKDEVLEGTESKETVDFMELLKEKKDEIFKKVIKGETEPKIQTGAQAFTEKEWTRLLKQFDSAEDAIKEKMREEYAKRFKQQVNQTEKSDSQEDDKWFDSDLFPEDISGRI